jgi:exosortase A-associated hydrolase 1
MSGTSGLPSMAAQTMPAVRELPSRVGSEVATERAVLFDSAGERLLGLLHPACGCTGVVIVVGGPQVRIGSHRYFLKLARILALAGYPVLRFDACGMGDSTGPRCTFEDIGQDIGAAIDVLMAQQPQVTGVVLWGLCDGASAALLYLDERPDPRIVGLCLLNPWARSPQSQARTHVRHYYLQRLKQREFWLKLLSGRITADAAVGLWRNLRIARRSADQARLETVSFQGRMARAWRAFDGPIWLGLSSADYTAKEFIEFVSADLAWQSLLARPDVHRLDLPGADHTLSDGQAQSVLATDIRRWLAAAASMHVGSPLRPEA